MLYLASASPRRRQILSWLEIPFITTSINFDEENYKQTYQDRLDREDLSAGLAYEKARLASRQLQEGLILTADTEVYLEDKPLGKPKDLKQAKQMLMTLSGREHYVVTAVCLIQAETQDHRIEIETSIVEFFNLSEAVIDKYLKAVGRQVLDKAGAYAIQSQPARTLISGWQGSLSNIIGLPLRKTADLLEEFGLIINKEVQQLALDKLGVKD